MTRPVEVTAFLAVAVLMHLGAWFGMARSGSEAAGSGGQATVSLMAASGDIADLVEAWTRPVEAAQTLETPLTPPAPEAAPLVRTALSDLPPLPARPDAPAQPSEDAPARVLRPSPLPDVPDVPQIDQPRVLDTLTAPQTAFERPAEVAAFDAPRMGQMGVPSSAFELPEVDPSSERSALLDAAPRRSLRPQLRPDPTAPDPIPNSTPRQPAAQAPAPQPQSTGAVPQTAAGQRSGQNAGNADTQRAATLSPATRQTLLAQWGASVRNSVERQKRFPRGTQASGTTVIRLTVARSGGLVSASIARSSGTAALDQAALSAVRRARFRPAPGPLDVPQFSFNLPLRFNK